MTYEQGVRIAARAIACYFLFWVVTDITGIPGEIVTLSHEWQMAHILDASTLKGIESPTLYLLRISLVNLTANLLRIGLWLLAARWFYNPGPRIRRFFGEFAPEPNAAETPRDPSNP